MHVGMWIVLYICEASLGMFGIRFSSRFVGHVVLPDVLVGRPLYIEKIKIMKRPNDNRWIPDSLWRKGLMPQSAGQKTLADINTTMYRHDLTCTGQHKHDSLVA